MLQATLPVCQETYTRRPYVREFLCFADDQAAAIHAAGIKINDPWGCGSDDYVCTRIETTALHFDREWLVTCHWEPRRAVLVSRCYFEAVA